MSIQKRIGYLIGIFSLFAYGNNLYSRVLRNTTFFMSTDIIFYLAIILGVFCIYKENIILQALQVSIFIVTGIFTGIKDSFYVSIPIFSFAFLLAYTYGAFIKYTKIKLISVLILGYIISLLSNLPLGTNKIIKTFQIISFMYVFILGLYFMYQEAIKKVQAYETSKEKVLLEKIEKLEGIIEVLSKKTLEAVNIGKESLQYIDQLKGGSHG